AEPEDDAGLVLLDDAQTGEKPEPERNHEDEPDHVVAFVSAAPSGTTCNVSPRTAITRARAPADSGSGLSAFHSSPPTRMVPSSRTSPTSPISAKAPVLSGWRALCEKLPRQRGRDHRHGRRDRRDHSPAEPEVGVGAEA